MTDRGANDLDAQATRNVVVPGRRRRGFAHTRAAGTRLTFGRWWWAMPAVALIIGVHYIGPAIGGFFSLTDWSGFGDWNFIGLDNFIRIFQSPELLLAIGNTIFLAVGAVVLKNVLGLLFALALNRMLKSRYILRTLLFLPVVLSPLAIAYVWKFIYEFDGPLNGFLALIGLEDLQKVWLGDPAWSIWAILLVVVWQSMGVMMVIYLAGLATVPLELDEAAVLDGAGVWARFWHITLPSILPAVAIATTLSIIQGLRIFDEIFALTGGGPAGATETLATQVYTQSFALGEFGFGSALALVLTVLILVFAILQQFITRNRDSREV
jgi:raffinose/stachyose/melibiose transport system permease protein